MRICILLFFCVLLQTGKTRAQVNFTANTKVPAYDNAFSYGINPGYSGEKWKGKFSDILMGNPAATPPQPGIGVTGIRYSLRNDFLEKWGYNFNVSTMTNDKKLGAFDNVAFLSSINEVAAANLDATMYCPGDTSHIFKNLYEPIWDSNNGTPVNENNPYALYVYKTAQQYKGFIKFWEVWNEPDFTSSTHGWEDSTKAGSWFKNAPAPCDLTNLLAPIYYYNRMMRISYEVIKTVDPTAYVATGGLGYTSFLQAMLMNTDNPDGGKVTASYPLKAGAYFDVLSYHDYPQFGVKTGVNRHSDAAATAVITLKNQMQEVLSKYGYNGVIYPKKHFILTEVNVAKKSFGGFLGGKDVQINFLLKIPVFLQANGVKQMHIYCAADVKTLANATDNFDLMGLYENLNDVQPYNQAMQSGGIAYKTVSNILFNSKYDPITTASLTLPASVGGGAFKTKQGKSIYVLWAKTTIDNSETASATYTFPASFSLASLEKRAWDFSQTGTTTALSASGIALTDTPIFLTEKGVLAVEEGEVAPGLRLTNYPNPFRESCTISYTFPTSGKLTLSLFDVHGRLIRVLEQTTFKQSGSYIIEWNADGMPDGNYYCRLETENSSLIHQLALFK